MSYPFIIWTMHRSGSTSLADLLVGMSEHNPAEHEPFNWSKKRDRQFAQVTRNWKDTHDEPALMAALADIFAQRYLIKHCYQEGWMFEMAFNAGIMKAAIGTDYRHVLLHRRDEVSRMLSQFVAEATGSWAKEYAGWVFARVRKGAKPLPPLPVKDFVERFVRARKRAEQIRAWLVEFGLDFHEVAYEDLYTGPHEPRLRTLAQLFGFLGFPDDAIERHRALIEEKIFGSGQDTASIVPLVPNLAEVFDALAAAGYHPPLPETLTADRRIEAGIAQAGAQAGD